MNIDPPSNVPPPAPPVKKPRGRGRPFQPGWKGGPGSLPRATTADYLCALRTTVSKEDWINIARRAVADALDGDAKARDWLSKYLMGEDPVGREHAAQLQQQGTSSTFTFTLAAPPPPSVSTGASDAVVVTGGGA